MIMIKDVRSMVASGWCVFNAQGVGSRSAISRSKSKNKIATRKKRMEKGRRAVPRGSNPHSYGESFSEFGFISGSQKLISISSVVMMVIIRARFKIFIIPS